MRMPLRLALSLLPLAGGLSAQVPPVPAAAGAAQAGEDPQLAALLAEVLAQNPDLARARSLQAAERERLPQARALADPVVSLGIQNDGFKKIQVGEMETSYYQLMVSQALPWPGKRDLRGAIARLGADTADTATQRTRLGLEAETRRGYAGLVLLRGQRQLLEEQGLFLRQAEAIARDRYGVGQGSQADLFRAQLELTRLQQTRISLVAEERNRVAGLNRLRAQPLDREVATAASLETLVGPVSPDPEPNSPELRAARLATEQAERSLELAKLDSRPDFQVSAGVMPRGGFEPMWTASVGVSVPLWKGQKQHRAVAEQEQRRRAQGSEAQSVRNLLALRGQERANQLEAATGALRLYREGLLAQSEGSFRATLAQYEAGLAPFLTVLEALNGWVADRSGYLQAQAQVLAIRIASAELNLGPTPGIGAATLTAPAMGSTAGAASAGRAAGSGPAPAGSDSAAPSMKSM